MTDSNSQPTFIDAIRFNADGLVPIVTQDAASGEILMFAWANAEAVALTVSENRAVYWSRSRGKLWRKGEESGNVQKLVELRLDCDADVLCYRVEQVGGIACHTGRRSCFYQRLENGEWRSVEQVLKDPKQLYSA
ncbi:MAG: phosphoribosyl-AMP cyclohydrolase [Gammaproteobacteria bacterium]|jgi:phosphoribosyl-AMP cyclohydrolase|nr:phosphoribosyl-AMP cyclohydrolase [Gammaproteobacteria bacterium]